MIYQGLGLSEIISENGFLSFKKQKPNVYDYMFSLEEQIRQLENERQLLKAHSQRLEVEHARMREEFEQIKNYPLIVGVIEELLPGKKAIIKNYAGMKFLIKVPENFIEPLLINSRVALSQKNLALVEVLPEETDSRAKLMEVIDRPATTFDEVGGLKQVIQELEESVILPLTHPESFKKLGIKPPNGVLLYGATGTGKTLLVKAIANKTKSAFIKVNASEFARKYIGEGAGLVRDVFKIAKEKKQAIIFIDEIDAIGSVREELGSGGEREIYRTLMQLLAELDGFSDREGIKVIAATNRVDMLDPALLRPGRFDRLIEVPMPCLDERIEIFKIHSKGMNLSKGISFKKFAELAENATGADIKAVCTEAGMFALREQTDKIDSGHFGKAVEKVLGDETTEPEDNAIKMLS